MFCRDEGGDSVVDAGAVVHSGDVHAILLNDTSGTELANLIA